MPKIFVFYALVSLSAIVSVRPSVLRLFERGKGR